MPTIIENTQQVNALNEIEAALGVIKSINAIIGSDGGTISILYKPEKGRKTTVLLPDAARGKVVGILRSTKERMSKDIRAKASKYHISLDVEDLACMSDTSPTDGTEEELDPILPTEIPDSGGEADPDDLALSAEASDPAGFDHERSDDEDLLDG